MNYNLTELEVEHLRSLIGGHGNVAKNWKPLRKVVQTRS